eukprot:scaffold40784_cov75-Phaeocystis_antarctica.AAC.2
MAVSSARASALWRLSSPVPIEGRKSSEEASDIASDEAMHAAREAAGTIGETISPLPRLGMPLTLNPARRRRSVPIVAAMTLECCDQVGNLLRLHRYRSERTPKLYKAVHEA